MAKVWDEKSDTILKQIIATTGDIGKAAKYLKVKPSQAQKRYKELVAQGWKGDNPVSDVGPFQPTEEEKKPGLAKRALKSVGRGLGNFGLDVLDKNTDIISKAIVRRFRGDHFGDGVTGKGKDGKMQLQPVLQAFASHHNTMINSLTSLQQSITHGTGIVAKSMVNMGEQISSKLDSINNRIEKANFNGDVIKSGSSQMSAPEDQSFSKNESLLSKLKKIPKSKLAKVVGSVLGISALGVGAATLFNSQAKGATNPNDKPEPDNLKRRRALGDTSMDDPPDPKPDDHKDIETPKPERKESKNNVIPEIVVKGRDLKFKGHTITFEADEYDLKDILGGLQTDSGGNKSKDTKTPPANNDKTQTPPANTDKTQTPPANNNKGGDQGKGGDGSKTGSTPATSPETGTGPASLPANAAPEFKGKAYSPEQGFISNPSGFEPVESGQVGDKPFEPTNEEMNDLVSGKQSSITGQQGTTNLTGDGGSDTLEQGPRSSIKTQAYKARESVLGLKTDEFVPGKLGSLASGGEPKGPGGDHSIPSAEVDKAHQTVSKMTGIDPNYVRAIGDIESSNDPSANRNKSSQYKGLYQIGPDEWKKYGNGGDIFNANDQAKAAGAMWNDQIAAFTKKVGRPPTASELYMIHQQGPSGSAAIALGAKEGLAADAALSKYANLPKDQARTHIMKNIPGGMDNNVMPSAADFQKGWENRLQRGYDTYAKKYGVTPNQYAGPGTPVKDPYDNLKVKPSDSNLDSSMLDPNRLKTVPQIDTNQFTHQSEQDSMNSLMLNKAPMSSISGQDQNSSTPPSGREADGLRADLDLDDLRSSRRDHYDTGDFGGLGEGRLSAYDTNTA